MICSCGHDFEPIVRYDHRLIVGDCTDAAVVNRIVCGDKVNLIVTSPPYWVGKEYETDTSFGEHLSLLSRFAEMCVKTVVPGGFIFVNFGEINAQCYSSRITGKAKEGVYPISKDYWDIFHDKFDCRLYAMRVWYKPFYRLQKPFWSYQTSIPHHQEWEHIWTWQTPCNEKKDQVYDWDISVHAVWDTRDEATDDRPLTRHVAGFPVCLPERALRAHSGVGDVVLDLFSGSGTTIVACIKLKRHGLGIEINPGYVAVSLERFDSIGIKPRLIT